VSAFPVRACVCGVGLLLAVLAAPAAAAPNLLTNGATFPLAQLGWQRTGSGAGFTPFSTAAGTISTGAATPAGGTPTPLDLRLTVSYADPISSLPFQSSLTYMAATP
jgi:hypothetical protein